MYMKRDRLTFDIRKDLEKIDSAMTKIIMNPDTARAFVADPNGVMVTAGLHPPTAPEVNERVNRCFYAVVSNSELTQFMAQHYESFVPKRAEEYQRYHERGLQRGLIQNRIDYDLEAAEHILRDRKALTTAFRLMLTDFNKRGIFKRRYSRKEIDQYLSVLVPAIIDRKPIREHPRLEEWDRNYGIGGFHYGAEAVEVGPVVTAYTAVEVGLLVTVAGVQARFMTSDEFVQAASEGSEPRIRALATMSRITQFGADIIHHAYQFEAM
jgi:hypothetical protein